jgi:glycosyltransferase involved in cell wall biosynthesis
MRVAILIPCHNEAATIARVVNDFRTALPAAAIHVYDNNSRDATAAEARSAGATVHRAPVQGKGSVVRQMFREADADICVMVDGDGTYPADRVHDLIAPVAEGRADMVVGARLAQHEEASFRPLHVFGNRLVLNTINLLFDAKLTDVMSGYRAFSRRFVKTTPVLSPGFEVETEMTLHALEHRLPIVEVAVPYGARPSGSVSKLNTFRDGYRVLKTIARLFKDHKPLLFFGVVALLSLLISLAIGVVILEEWQAAGKVAPARAVLAAGLALGAAIALAVGLILDTVNRRSRELMALLTDHVIIDCSATGVAGSLGHVRDTRE